MLPVTKSQAAPCASVLPGGTPAHPQRPHTHFPQSCFEMESRHSSPTGASSGDEPGPWAGSCGGLRGTRPQCGSGWQAPNAT